MERAHLYARDLSKKSKEEKNEKERERENEKKKIRNRKIPSYVVSYLLDQKREIRDYSRLPWRGTRFHDGTPRRYAAVFACRTRHYVQGCIAS